MDRERPGIPVRRHIDVAEPLGLKRFALSTQGHDRAGRPTRGEEPERTPGSLEGRTEVDTADVPIVKANLEMVRLARGEADPGDDLRQGAEEVRAHREVDAIRNVAVHAAAPALALRSQQEFYLWPDRPVFPPPCPWAGPRGECLDQPRDAHDGPIVRLASRSHSRSA